MTAKQRTTLVAYDGSATAKAAVTYAARQLPPDGRLVVAHVVAPPAHYLDELYDERRGRPRERGERLLRDVKETLGAVPAELRVAEGPPAHTLLELAREVGADEIVVGSRGVGAARALLGSVSHALLHETDRPVVVLTDRAAERQARRDAAEGAINGHMQIVGYDGSSTARAALDYALARGPVTAVCVSDDPLRGRDLLQQPKRDAGAGRQSRPRSPLQGACRGVGAGCERTWRRRDRGRLARARTDARGPRQRVRGAAARSRRPGRRGASV
jgi:nucleotide-binding universal stress UspA family protein